MKLAMQKQKNISSDVKSGVSELDELFDIIESLRRNWTKAEEEAEKSRAAKPPEAQTATSDLMTPTAASSKRRASSPVEQGAKKKVCETGNMHRCTTADLLLPQIMLEHEVDIAVLSEQYASPSAGWFIEDLSSTAAIWCKEISKLHVTNSGAGNGYVWIASHRLTIISCYLTPSDTIAGFQAKLENIEDLARQISGNLIIAGDFNSKAMEWGSRTTNSRGQRILDMAARLGLVVANVGNKATFRRPGCEGTIPDITLVSESYASNIREWTVLEDYNGSDHQYITYCVGETNTSATKYNKSSRKWNARKLDRPKLIAKIDENESNHEEPNSARLKIQITLRRLTQACSAAMPRIKGAHPKKSVYWWTDEICGLRQICIKKRRKYTRARRTGLAIEEHAEYKEAKRILKTVIQKSKKEKWEELRRDINQNPWGLGYKIVLNKLGARQRPPELSEATMENIVNTLFPTHDLRADREYIEENDLPPSFTVEELKAAAATLKNNKAPGPDGIPSEVLKVIANERPQVLLNMYNVCLCE
ncbi:uncharacterized protein LOC128864739 [Anastrepha ludens]|uniref:uncharacterized protein LOC128864739 n=1 Tax=Anastrepha ludens TaxID=28586 RepID=UPI0023B0A52A|nr:uncharacterized protein LOC128864739 [Anastrepha ludens]